MPINEWSDDILIGEMSEEPDFSDEAAALIKKVQSRSDRPPHVVVDMKNVSYLNSSNVAQLIQLRQVVEDAKGKLRICALQDQVWSVLLISGLDKLFEFNDDVATGLASLQIE